MVLELGGFAGLDCVMTGVVRSRGNLVDIKSSYDEVRLGLCRRYLAVATVWELEHLDAEDTSTFKSQDGGFRKTLSVGYRRRVGRSQWGESEQTNIILVDGLDGWI